MHYLLFYEVGPDYVARRAAYREQHLTLAWAAHERGELVLGGALADPVDGAVPAFMISATILPFKRCCAGIGLMWMSRFTCRN